MIVFFLKASVLRVFKHREGFPFSFRGITQTAPRPNRLCPHHSSVDKSGSSFWCTKSHSTRHTPTTRIMPSLLHRRRDAHYAYSSPRLGKCETVIVNPQGSPTYRYHELSHIKGKLVQRSPAYSEIPLATPRHVAPQRQALSDTYFGGGVSFSRSDRCPSPYFSSDGISESSSYGPASPASTHVEVREVCPSVMSVRDDAYGRMYDDQNTHQGEYPDEVEQVRVLEYKRHKYSSPPPPYYVQPSSEAPRRRSRRDNAWDSLAEKDYSRPRENYSPRYAEDEDGETYEDRYMYQPSPRPVYTRRTPPQYASPRPQYTSPRPQYASEHPQSPPPPSRMMNRPQTAPSGTIRVGGVIAHAVNPDRRSEEPMEHSQFFGWDTLEAASEVDGNDACSFYGDIDINYEVEEPEDEQDTPEMQYQQLPPPPPTAQASQWRRARKQEEYYSPPRYQSVERGYARQIQVLQYQDLPPYEEEEEDIHSPIVGEDAFHFMERNRERRMCSPTHYSTAGCTSCGGEGCKSTLQMLERMNKERERERREKGERRRGIARQRD